MRSFTSVGSSIYERFSKISYDLPTLCFWDALLQHSEEQAAILVGDRPVEEVFNCSVGRIQADTLKINKTNLSLFEV